MQQLLKQDSLGTKDLVICASKDYIFRSLLDHKTHVLHAVIVYTHVRMRARIRS